MADVRINKFVAASGYCSRRQADRLIAEGAIEINGKRAVLGDRVNPDEDCVTAYGKRLNLPSSDELVYLALNKPAGIECTTDRRRRGNVIDFIAYPKRIFFVGRLDKASRGLLLLTNDGSIVNRMMRARYQHEKEYRVTVDRPLTDAFLEGMRSGVPILNTITRPCEVIAETDTTFRIILTQGLNRQIRRMCAHFGYEVNDLIRLRIMHITLEGLPEGQWRHLTRNEVEEIRRLKASSDS